MPTEDELFDSDLREAIAWTEREIAAEAFSGGLDPEDREANQVMLEDMSQVEEIDGRPQSMLEVAESTLRNGAYQHHPIESDEIAARDAAIAEKDQRIAQLEEWNRGWKQTYDDAFGEGDRQKQEQQFENNAWDRYGIAFAGTPEQKRLFMQDVAQSEQQKAWQAQQLQQQHSDDVNQSLQRAFDDDPALAEVYHNIINGDQRSMRVRGLATDIVNAGDRAGEVLASVRDDPSIRALRRSDAAHRSGFNDQAVNDHIFDSIWND